MSEARFAIRLMQKFQPRGVVFGPTRRSRVNGALQPLVGRPPTFPHPLKTGQRNGHQIMIARSFFGLFP